MTVQNRERLAVIRKYEEEGRLPAAPGYGQASWFRDLPQGPEMVVVPPGDFIMGEIEWAEPLHKVTLTVPFAVGRFPITFEQWDASGLRPKPSDEGWGRGKRPVINVSWNDARAYTGWLSKRTGKAYRLLSEAEWEYCCRAGTTAKCAFGDEITKNQANVAALKTCEVDKFAPNAWGIYDMHGNAWEWCEDNEHVGGYEGAPNDGSVWRGGNPDSRIKRGGCFDLLEFVVLSGLQGRSAPDKRDSQTGFRVARTL